MTVKELIFALNNVKDKSQTVYISYSYSDGKYIVVTEAPIKHITEDENGVMLYDSNTKTH